MSTAIRTNTPHRQIGLSRNRAAIARRRRNVAVWILQGLLATVFAIVGFAKLSGNPMMVVTFEQLGFGQWFRYLSGSIEVLFSALLLVRPLAAIAAAVLGCTMLGATLAHAMVGGSPIAAIVLGTLCAVVSWYRWSGAARARDETRPGRMAAPDAAVADVQQSQRKLPSWMRRRIAVVVAVAGVISFLPSLLIAGENPPPAVDLRPAPEAMPSWEVQFRSSYTGEGVAEFRGADSAEESDASSLELSIGHKVTLNNSWALLFQIGSTNLYLNSVPGAPIPDSIHTLRLTTGIEYKPGEKLTLMALFIPSLYRLEDVGSDDVGLSGGLLMNYRSSPTLKWSLGVLATSDSSLSPVLPIGGVEWKMNDKLELQLVVPKPRLVYTINSAWSVFAGGDLTGTTFRTKRDFSAKNGFAGHDNAVADYRDLRVGGGLGFQINRGMRLEVEGGYSVYREIDYIDLDKKVKFDPAPYVGVSLRAFF